MALLGQDQIEHRLEELDGWDLEGHAIVKQFKGDDFTASVEFVNRVVPVANELDHHPDLSISWDTVTVLITTHSEGGLTESDFELARRIDGLAS